MGDDKKPFECSVLDCGMTFANEDHLVVHRRKHKLSLSLGGNGGKGAHLIDQTPTPTRFIKNCEEVGLFQDLQTVGVPLNQMNPFEETFRKATESGRSFSVSTNDNDDNSHDSDTLNTPLLPSDDVTPTRPTLHNSISVDDADVKLFVHGNAHGLSDRRGDEKRTAVDGVGNISTTGKTWSNHIRPTLTMNTQLPNTTSVIQLGTPSPVIYSPTPPVSISLRQASRVLDHDEFYSSEADLALDSLARGLTTNAAVPSVIRPSSLPIGSAEQRVQYMLKLPDGQTVPISNIPGQAAPVIIQTVNPGHLATPSPLTTSQNASHSFIAQTTIVPASVVRPQSIVANALSDTKARLKHKVLTSPSFAGAKMVGGSPTMERVKMAPAAALLPTSVDQNDNVFGSAKVESSNNNENSRKRSSLSVYSDNEDNSDESKRQRFLERNRAAATRCRQKRKQWINGLEDKNKELVNINAAIQQEVIALRAEVAELKSLFLAHKDCPVTQQQREEGVLNSLTPNRDPPPPIPGAVHHSMSEETITIQGQLPPGMHYVLA